MLNNTGCRREPWHRKSSKWKALGRLCRPVLSSDAECVTASLKHSGEQLRRKENESLSSRSSHCWEGFGSSLLPGTARHLDTALLPAPSSQCVCPLRPAPGLVPVFTVTVYNGNYYIIRQFPWKKTFVNKKRKLPRGKFYQFTCKAGIVADGLNANPAETLSPSPTSRTRWWLVLPPQQEGKGTSALH